MKKRFIEVSIITMATILIVGILIYANQYRGEKIVLVVIDGATWNVILPMVEKGELPNFARLMNEGSYGNLTSTSIPLSASAWTSIATGTWPDKHGLTDFGYLKIEPITRNSKWMPYTSAAIKTDPIWRIMSNHGIKVGVVDWLYTWPPDKINGFMVSTINQLYEKLSNYTYPSTLQKEISSEIPKPINISIYAKINNDEAFIESSLSDEDYRMNEFLYLMDKYKPDFSATGFYKSTDGFQHFYWSYKEPRYFDVNREEAEKYGNVIETSYSLMDRFIGELLNKNLTVLVVSDHGFAWNAEISGPILLSNYESVGRNKHFTLSFNKLLQELGFLTLEDYNKIFRASSIVFSKTKAYFCNNFTATGVCINLKGREQQGIVEQNDYEALRDEIIEKMKDIRLENGENLFVGIQKTTNSTVDILFDVNPIMKNSENFVFIETMGALNQKFTNVAYIKYNNKKLDKIIINNYDYWLKDFIKYYEPGNHQMNGIILMKGTDIKSDYLIKNAKVVDVAPTILYLMGEAIPKNMDGRILVEAIDKNFTAKTPIRYSEEKIDS
ncbi:MAG: alkaline phosphatase family protein, partial [Candidatus Aenigmatarchaeota archaeon]